MNKDILLKAGVDYDEGLERFSGRVESYEKYLYKFIDDESFQKLEASMNEKDFKRAFEIAHDLKGNVGNLSINKLYKLLCSFVDELRDGKDTEKACELLPSVLSEYKIVLKALKESL